MQRRVSMFTGRAALPCWAVVAALLTLSPLPLTVPSGIALAAIGLIGWMLVIGLPGERLQTPIATRRVRRSS
jgi:hypothetical protein